MRMIVGAVLALSLLAGTAEGAEPREVVGHVADQITARYFDVEKGARIAAELKAEAAKGVYDRYADPRDLATALSVRLKPQDSHFQVTWQTPSAAPMPGGPRPAAGGGGPAEANRRQNYGFRGVEVLPGNIALLTMSSFAGFGGPDDPAKQAADAAWR